MLSTHTIHTPTCFGAEHRALRTLTLPELVVGSLSSSVAHGRAQPTLGQMSATNLMTRPITVLACNSSQPPAVPLSASNFPDHRVQLSAHLYAVYPGIGVIRRTPLSASHKSTGDAEFMAFVSDCSGIWSGALVLDEMKESFASNPWLCRIGEMKKLGTQTFTLQSNKEHDWFLAASSR